MLSRHLDTHEVMNKPIALRVLLRLCYKANYEDDEELKKGECFVTRHTLAKELKFKPNDIRTALQQLESYGLIEITSGKKGSVIKITPFALYNPQNQIGQEEVKKIEEMEEERQNALNAKFEEFWHKYPNKFNYIQTKESFIKTANIYGTDTILNALDNYLKDLMNCDYDYIIKSTNFVGQKAKFKDYLELYE